MSRNTLARTDGRQCIQTILEEFSLADFTDNDNVIDLALPANSVVVGGFVAVTDNSDAGTTDVLDVGDSTTANRYKNDIDLKTAALTALVPTGAKNDHVRLTRVPVGTAATGLEIRVVVQYATLGVSESTQD